MSDKLNLLSLSVKIPSKNKAAFTKWQTDLHHQIAGTPGFVSLEILSPVLLEDSWKIVQRFDDNPSIDLWKAAAGRKELMDRLKQIALDHEIEESLVSESNAKNGVTEVFITNVSEENEKNYREWIAKIHQIEVQFPGFRGVYVQSPSPGEGHNWITLLQFDTPQHLDHWLTSSERKTLLLESKSLISSLEKHRVISPYGNWFSSLDRAGQLPPKWKQTMVILLVLFPIVMMQFKFVMHLMKGWDISLATFVANAMSVTLISWPFMPIAINFLKWWLLPKGPNPQTINMIGVLFLFILYALEVTIFWSFV